MSIEKDLSVIRENNYYKCIWYCIKFKDKILFLASANDTYIPFDMNTNMIYVEDGNIKVFKSWIEAMHNRISIDEYNKALKNKIFIDIKPEEFVESTNSL